MIAPFIVAAGLLAYFIVTALELVRFVAEDMRHYWQQGSDYSDSDLSDAIVAGAVRGLAWPFTYLLVGIRWVIRTSAYRLAANWWDRHSDEPAQDLTTHRPRHSAA